MSQYIHIFIIKACFLYKMNEMMQIDEKFVFINNFTIILSALKCFICLFLTKNMQNIRKQVVFFPYFSFEWNLINKELLTM